MPAYDELQVKQQRELLERLEAAGRGDLARLVRQGLAQRPPPFRVPIDRQSYVAVRNTSDGGLGAWYGHGSSSLELRAPEERVDVRPKRDKSSRDATPRRSVRLSDEDWAELAKEGDPCSVARRILEEFCAASRARSSRPG